MNKVIEGFINNTDYELLESLKIAIFLRLKVSI